MGYEIIRVPTDKNTGQKNSPAYRLAALDPDFLLGDFMRGVRLQLEYEKAEERLRAWVVRSTIVVFRSARVRPRGNSHKAEFTATLWPGAVTPPGDQSAVGLSPGVNAIVVEGKSSEQLRLPAIGFT